MTDENIEALEKWAELGIALSTVFEAIYLAAGDNKNAEKSRAFNKFAKSGKELLETFK